MRRGPPLFFGLSWLFFGGDILYFVYARLGRLLKHQEQGNFFMSKVRKFFFFFFCAWGGTGLCDVNIDNIMVESIAMSYRGHDMLRVLLFMVGSQSVGQSVNHPGLTRFAG